MDHRGKLLVLLSMLGCTQGYSFRQPTLIQASWPYYFEMGIIRFSPQMCIHKPRTFAMEGNSEGRYMGSVGWGPQDPFQLFGNMSESAKCFVALGLQWQMLVLVQSCHHFF